jgi:hypothetical protein
MLYWQQLKGINMRIHKDNKFSKISLIAVFIFLSCEWMPQIINLIILLLISTIYLIKQKSVGTRFPGDCLYLFLFVIGTIVGFIHFYIGDYSLYIIFKHMYYYLLPLLYWIAGKFLFRKGDKNVLQTIIFAATLISIYDLIHTFYSILNVEFESLYQYRMHVGTGSFMPFIGIYIIVFYRNEYIVKYRYLLLILYLLSFLAHFSRTSILKLIIFVLFSGIRYNWNKIFKIGICIIIAFAFILNAFPIVKSDFWTKILDSFNEINFDQSMIGNFYAINHNWRGYEMYCEMIKFQNAGILEKIIGGGFGATLDVFGYEHFVTTEAQINILHNGYGTQVMVFGITGIALFLLWFRKLYIQASFMVNRQDIRLIRGIAVTILITTYFVHGPFFSNAQAIYLMYIAMFNQRNTN